jgi:hypothetical protein
MWADHTRRREGDRSLRTVEGPAAPASSGMREVAGRARRLVGTHVAFSVVFATGAVLRVVVALAYQPALLLQRDTYAYLLQASATTPSGLRPALYALLLKPLVATGELALVPVAQHVAGLATGLVVYAMVLRLTGGRLGAVLASAPVLLDGYQLIIEQYVLTESFFQLLAVAGIALLVWHSSSSPARLALVGLLLGAAGLTRFAGLAIIVPAMVYVLARRPRWVTCATLAVFAALPLLLYSLWFRNTTGSFGLTNRNGFVLYGRVASFADCSVLTLPPTERRLCPGPEARERAAALGVWGSGMASRMRDSRVTNRLLLDFSRRVIVQQPLDYARAVVRDLGRFFAASSPEAREPNALRWRFPRSIDEAQPHPFVRRLRGAPPPGLGLGNSFHINVPLARALRAYQSLVYTRGPLLALYVLASLAGVAAARRPGLPGVRSPRGECLMLLAAGTSLLLFPALTAVYHFRYALSAVPFVCAAGAVGAALVAGRVRRPS